jgi:putative MATE family efflux protein
MKNILFKDKAFTKTLISIALPIVIQNFISSSLNMVDTMMIGRIGETEIASVGLANQYFFLFMLLLFGTNSGSAIFIAQFWGKQDIKNIRRVLGICLITGGTGALIFTAGALTVPDIILSIFSEDIKVIELGSKYLKIVGFSYIITCISFAFGFASRSIGQAKLPMLVSIIALGCNTLLNYLLIFGNFGFPKMGIEGAALATLISRIIEMVMLLAIIYNSKGVLAGKLYQMLDLSKEFVIKVFKTTLPVIINEFFWALGMTVYSIAYARIGTSAIAAVNISNTIQNLFLVISFGLANACAVMIGNKIGAKEEEVGIEYAKRFSILVPLIGIIMGVILYIFSPVILSLFKITPEGYDYCIKILVVLSICMPIRMLNSTVIVGILRSGGDTKYSLCLEMGTIWLVGVPLAFLGAFIWKLPVYWVVALVSIEQLVKSLIGIPRVYSRKWLKNVVDNI